MDRISPLNVGTLLWLLAGFWCLYLSWKVRYNVSVVLGLVLVWGLVAQWFVRANWNYRWVDEPELYVLHEAIFQAIKTGKREITVDKIWNMNWRSICFAPMYWNKDWHEGGDITIKEALGVENEKGLKGYDTENIFVGNGKEFFVIEPQLERFWFKVFQNNQYQEYRRRLDNLGYEPMFMNPEEPDKDYIRGCYALEKVRIKILEE